MSTSCELALRWVQVPQDWTALADVQPEALNMAQGELPKVCIRQYFLLPPAGKASTLLTCRLLQPPGLSDMRLNHVRLVAQITCPTMLLLVRLSMVCQLICSYTTGSTCQIECPRLLQLAFMTTTSDSFRQIQLWTQYHRALGVQLFYLFVDGQVSSDSLA
jgi:hypothetical protein